MSSGRKKIILSGKHAVQTVEVVTEGQVLADRYELKREIARGGMGIVFEAVDRELDNRIAIKILPPELASSEKYKVRLRREAIAAIKLTHPAILRLHSFESDGDIVFLIMEYLTGPNLDQATIDPPTLPLDEVLEIARQVCPALDYAHKCGVIHRDIKPANLIYHEDGNERVVKVTDFGIAFVVKDSISRVSGIESAGTLLYVSPEQLQGAKPGPRSDQYSLATSLYELLSGETPFTGVGLSYQVINATPQPIDNVPQYVNDAILKSLSKDPEDRFPSCSALLDALEGKVQVESSSRKNKGKGKSILRFLSALIIFVLLALFGVYQYNRRKPRILKDWKPPVTKTASATAAPGPTQAPTPTPAPPQPLTVSPTPTVVATKRVPTTVDVLFTTNPRGAKIFDCNRMDKNNLVGIATDTLKAQLLPGVYEFKFVLADYRPTTKKFTVPQGVTSLPIHVELIKPFGTAVITPRVAGTTVKVDGKVFQAKEISLLKLLVGKHVIVGSKEGYSDHVVEVEIKDKEQQEIVLEPKLTPKGLAASKSFVNSIGMKLLWLPPGQFKMGGRRQDSPDEVPVHTVTIKSGFWMSRCEVTNGQFQKVMNSIPSRSRGPKRPVEQITWYAAKSFCEKLTKLEQSNKTISSDQVYQLPSETQWEYAARGGSTNRLGHINEMWCEDNSGGRTHDVGGRKANRFGLHDMLGNVWEWTADSWHSSYRGAPTDGSAWLKGGDSSYRSLRGGSWDFPRSKCRYSIRLKDVPSRRQEDVGFRVVVVKTK